MEVLKLCMNDYCCCYNLDFQSFTETHEDSLGQTLQDNVHFILMGPPTA